jgi:ferredoxin-NADP reductase
MVQRDDLLGPLLIPQAAQTEGNFIVDPNALQHVFIAEGDAAAAILQLFEESGHDIHGRVIVVYAETSPDSVRFVSALGDLPIDSLHTFPSIIAALSRLGIILPCSPINTRIYAAGSDTLITLILQLAVACGRDAQSVMISRISPQAPTD